MANKKIRLIAAVLVAIVTHPHDATYHPTASESDESGSLVVNPLDWSRQTPVYSWAAAATNLLREHIRGTG